MIKRLFRTWLRYKLFRTIFDVSNFEEVYQWVYKKPIHEWYLAIYCARCGIKHGYDQDNARIEHTDLKDVASMWNFFHEKKSSHLV